MKRRFLLLLLIAVICSLFGVSPNPASELARLEKLAAGGTRNADLNYNLGVAYFQTGDSGKATLHFLRALNVDSAHRPARQSLAYVQSLDPDLPKAPPQPFVLHALLGLYDFFNLNRLALLVLLAALLAVLCAHWLLHYPSDKERGLPILLLGIALSLLLISGAALLVKGGRYRSNSRAVVMKGGTALHAAETGDKAIRELPEASILILRETRGDRTRAILADGSSGWVSADAVERVIPRP